MKTVGRASVSLHVDPEVHERLVERARPEERSVSAALRVAIREYLRKPGVQRDATEEDA
jgi:predicted transcriptional regulator